MNRMKSCEVFQRLNEELAVIEANAFGLRIGGVGGGSPDGQFWHYEFEHVWPIPPDRASGRLFIAWSEWPEPESVRVTLFAEIYREAQISSFKKQFEEVCRPAELFEVGLETFVANGLEQMRQILVVPTGSELHPLRLAKP